MFTMTQREYNEDAMRNILREVIDDNGEIIFPYDNEDLTEEFYNNHLFNSEHSLRKLKKANTCFYMYLKEKIISHGKFKFEIKDLNTLYSSLILNNIEFLDIYNCNIGINDAINTTDKEFMCIKFDIIDNTTIKNSSFDYTLFFTSVAGRTINIDNCIIDTLFIDNNACANINIKDSYINNLYIYNSAVSVYLLGNTIKHFYTDLSNIFITTNNSSSVNDLFDNIYCYKTFIEVINANDYEEQSVPIDTDDDLENYNKERIYKTESKDVTYYKGDLNEYDGELISKLASLDIYLQIDKAIYGD